MKTLTFSLLHCCCSTCKVNYTMSELSSELTLEPAMSFHSLLKDIIYLCCCCFVFFFSLFFDLLPSGDHRLCPLRVNVLARQTHSGFNRGKSDSKAATSLSQNSSAHSHFSGFFLIQWLQQPRYIKNPSNEITVLIISYQVGCSGFGVRKVGKFQVFFLLFFPDPGWTKFLGWWYPPANSSLL